jgi:hypothetical protein
MPAFRETVIGVVAAVPSQLLRLNGLGSGLNQHQKVMVAARRTPAM